mmetsp:Transcript_24172/g.36006  ORF Transcript_24172/g.36006 Transcript_24172/m.36006 type:complete len:89 (-) Transcript_24172:483-749(-)
MLERRWRDGQAATIKQGTSSRVTPTANHRLLLLIGREHRQRLPLMTPALAPAHRVTEEAKGKERIKSDLPQRSHGKMRQSHFEGSADN